MSRRERFSHLALTLKYLIFQRIFRGAAIATTLGVLVCPQIACLMPQDVNPTKPGAVGNVPVFLTEKFPDYLLPPILSLTRQGSTDAAASPPCHCQLWFDHVRMSVDPDVTLEARWFVDYQASNPASTIVKQKETLLASFDPTKTERELLQYQFDADTNQITASGVHIVEVVVAEAGGFNDDPNSSLPSRAMNPGYVSATYRFALDVTVEQVLGQCSRTAPSHAICQ